MPEIKKMTAQQCADEAHKLIYEMGVHEKARASVAARKKDSDATAPYLKAAEQAFTDAARDMVDTKFFAEAADAFSRLASVFREGSSDRETYTDLAEDARKRARKALDQVQLGVAHIMRMADEIEALPLPSKQL